MHNLSAPHLRPLPPGEGTRRPPPSGQWLRSPYHIAGVSARAERVRVLRARATAAPPSSRHTQHCQRRTCHSRLSASSSRVRHTDGAQLPPHALPELHATTYSFHGHIIAALLRRFLKKHIPSWPLPPPSGGKREARCAHAVAQDRLEGGTAWAVPAPLPGRQRHRPPPASPRWGEVHAGKHRAGTSGEPFPAIT